MKGIALILALTCFLSSCAAVVMQPERTQNPPSTATAMHFYQPDRLADLKAYYD